MDRVGCEVICKSHSARSERDQYRICPSKLSKSDLEDLYFALLENNLQLKKTVNGQQDRIKVLSTKMQRMTSAQNVLRADENKYCCVATKAVVKQQKDMIAELKRVNERMADRIRKLNMRLCSAKQFCKSATPRGLRCANATSPYLIKHSPCSYKQQSHSTLKLAVSCHNLSRESVVTKCVQTEPCDSAKFEDENKLCEDNKCKTDMDELQEKIDDLEQKLSEKVEEGEALQAELLRSRGELVASEHERQRAKTKSMSLITSLRAAEGLASELKTQLSIEKRRVAELETRLKAATMSNRVSKSIEDTLTSIQESNKTSGVEVTYMCTCCSPRSKVDSISQQTYTGLSPNDNNYNDATKLSKSTDDSGYTDTIRSQNFMDDQSFNKIIEELTKRIVILQTQVDALTISPPEDDKMKKLVELTESAGHDVNTTNDVSDSTPKTINVPTYAQQQAMFIENSQEQKQLTDVETNEARLSYTGQEGNGIVFGSTPIPESSQSGTSEMKEENKDHNNIEEGKEKKDESKEYLESTSEKEAIITQSNENANHISTDSSKHDTYIKEISIKSGDKIENSKTPNKGIKNNKSKAENHIKKGNIPKRQDKLESDVKADNQTNNRSPRRLDAKSASRDLYGKKQGKSIIWKSLLNSEQQEKFRILTRTATVTRNVSSCEEATYTIESDRSGATSPDNTDYEISSMTDLTEDREPKSPLKNCLSPGEQKYPLAHSDSYNTPSTNYSLSEGEIPVTCTRRKSHDDQPRAELGEMTTAPKMEETLQAISEELARCRRLLGSRRPIHVAAPAHP